MTNSANINLTRRILLLEVRRLQGSLPVANSIPIYKFHTTSSHTVAGHSTTTVSFETNAIFQDKEHENDLVFKIKLLHESSISNTSEIPLLYNDSFCVDLSAQGCVYAASNITLLGHMQPHGTYILIYFIRNSCLLFWKHIFIFSSENNKKI